MAWYRTGTVTVTQGSATIVGAGTDFVSNAVMGDGFRGPDGRTCEIARVVSATELTLAEGYAGPSGGGQPYAIQPTQSYLRDLASSAATLLATFGAVRDGIGQGLIADGSPAAPALRFAADQDTGLRRVGENALALVTGGADRLTILSNGNVGLGQTSPQGARVDVAATSPDLLRLSNISSPGTRLVFTDSNWQAEIEHNSGSLRFKTNGATEGFRLQDGNLLVGVTSGSYHRIEKAVAGSADILLVRSSSTQMNSLSVTAATAEAYSYATSAIYVGKYGPTNRSINAGGTINASGADYAEYMVKGPSCGTIAAGDVCGVDVYGKLTRTWADALSFVVKSTDPAYVGGDTWASGLSPRPEMPGIEPIEPAAPPARPDDGDELAGWAELVAAYPATLAAWHTEHADWRAAMDAFERDLPLWEEALEAERVKVDRIAFCGQVPVNVTGDFAVGDYLIAAPAGAGIKAVAIAAADISFEQYRRRLGKVWAVRDGRAWVDVQHG